MKNLTSKLWFFAVMLMIATSCSGQNALKKYGCEIINTESLKTIKKSIDIRIPEQLTESQLREIANYLKRENGNYERLFILYYLPDMKIGSGAWASTHYNPDLEINIMGIDKKAEETMKTMDLPAGEIIGKWYDKTPYMEHSIIIFKINDKYKMKETFKDGSINEKDLQFTKADGNSKFVYENDFGEYLLIEKDGRLGQYDKDGLISIANKIE